MGQAEVINFLIKNKGKKFSAKQIAESLGVESRKVCNALNPLIKYGEVSYIEISWEEARELYNGEVKINRRLNLYYIED